MFIAKKGKDPVDCASYRPISLLNTDAKILAKVLALRLDEALPHNIHWSNRFYQEPTFVFLNVLYTPSHDQIPECIVSIDAAKAFDRIEWNYLFSVLNKYGFGPMFTGWIKLLYTATTAMVRTDGIISQPFRLGRGMLQGCPLSPILFDMAIEPLAIAFRDKTF